ncbi:MAG: hypothetical protein HY063_05645 [Bacteroidetes bacterium]|nr:hypothetical protein [Bacteroidota bacterium]
MRNIFFLLFFFNAPLVYCGTQDSSSLRNSFGFNLGINFQTSEWDAGLRFVPAFVYNYKKQSFLLTPTIFLDNPYNSHYSHTARGGIEGMYKIFPNGNNKMFNLYFFYRAGYSYYSADSEEKYYVNNQIYSGRSWEKYSELTNEVGYGFQLKAKSGIYLNQSLGFGVATHHINSGIENKTDPNLSRQDIPSDFFEYGYFSFFANIGIGYNFEKRKKEL